MRSFKITAVLTAIFLASSVLWLYAQKTNQPQFESGNPEFIALAKRIDAVAQDVRDLKRTNADIARKLDQVLSNQEKILSELAIVKVRASLPR